MSQPKGASRPTLTILTVRRPSVSVPSSWSVTSKRVLQFSFPQRQRARKVHGISFWLRRYRMQHTPSQAASVQDSESLGKSSISQVGFVITPHLGTPFRAARTFAAKIAPVLRCLYPRESLYQKFSLYWDLFNGFSFYKVISVVSRCQAPIKNALERM